MIEQLLALIAPHICCGCGKNGAILCEHCKYDITDNGPNICIECLLPTATSNLCRRCRPRLPWDNAWLAGWRQESLQQLIDYYKFERAKAGHRVLAELLDYVLPVLPDDTIVTYVPTISSHQRQRGYDHMALIARALARRRSWRYRTLLRRHKAPMQHGSRRVDRLTQQRGTFQLVSEEITAPVLLIDDIYTTGGTLKAAAEALTPALTGALYVAVVARQPGSGNRP